MHACKQTYIHAYKHAYMHSHVRTYIHSLFKMQILQDTDNPVNLSEFEAKICRWVPRAGKRVRQSRDWFRFYFGLVEKVARDLLANKKA